jgi:hypothetical protein
LRPTLVQQFLTTASVVAHGADQAIHLAQGLFALPLAIGFTAILADAETAHAIR